MLAILFVISNSNEKTGIYRCPVGYVHKKCENSKNKEVKIKENKLCQMKRVGRCLKRSRCCIKTTRCKGSKCKVTKKKCFWQGASLKAKCYKEICSFQKYGECHKR
jgi:hypothetical protein